MKQKPKPRNRWLKYETLKAKIKATAKTQKEYERRIAALTRKLNL